MTQNLKLMGVQYLEIIRVLYQNAEIDAVTKNRLTVSVKSGMKTGNFCETNRLFKLYTVGTDFGCLIENLTKQ